MTKIGERDVMLIFLELTGIEWEENYRAEDVRRDRAKIDALIGVNRLVAAGFPAALIREHCPSFCSAYRDVMLREVEEPIPYGSDDS